MPGTYCSVPECKNNSIYSRNVSWHKFPANKSRRNEWIRRLNRKSPSGEYGLWRPKAFHKICGAHFNVSGKKAPGDVNPRYFPGRELLDSDKRLVADATKDKTIKTICSCKFISLYEDFDLGQNIICENRRIIKSVNNKVTVSCQTDPEISINNLTDHNYCLTEEVAKNLSNYREDKEELTSRISNLETQVKIFKEENEKRVKEINCLTGKNGLLEYKCKRLERKKTIYKALKNESMLKFYTGFESVQRFTEFVKFIEPVYNVSYREKHNTNSRSGRKPKLPFLDQLFLVLSRLKLGLLEKDIAYRFNVSVSTISHIWSFWVDFLAAQVPRNSIWQGKELRWIVNALKIYLKVP